MATECSVSLVAQLLPEVVTWLLVVTGWLVVSDQQAQIEIAKNSYTRMHRIRDDMRLLESAAVEHHTEGYDEKRVRTILRSISALGIEITHLATRRHLGLGAPAYVADLRKAVTSSNFDKSSYKVHSTTSVLIQEIEAAKDSLDRILLEASESISARPRSLTEFLREIGRRLR